MSKKNQYKIITDLQETNKQTIRIRQTLNKNMQTKKVSQLNQLNQPFHFQPDKQRLFEKWLKKNNNNIQAPATLEQSFKNMQDPLEYIKGKSIQSLETQSNLIRQDMKLQKQAISDMSKSNFKKVISRERDDYKFGQSFREQTFNYRSGYQQFQKRSAKKKDQNIKKIEQIREQLKLQRQFIHNFFKTSAQRANQQRPLTLQVVKQIDTKQFEEKHKDVQFYDVLTRTNDSYEKYTSNYNDISENYDMDQLLGDFKFDLIDRDQHYSAKSTQFLFKAEDELDFWRRNAADNQENQGIDQVQVMKRCQNMNPKQPSFLYLLQFASGKINTPILSSYFKLKARQQAELKINQNDQNLQQQYNRKKQQYDFLREMKVKDKAQRVAIKYTKNTAQTIDNLQDQSFQSYFEQNAKDLLIKLEQLNKIRDNVIANDQPSSTRKVMLMNIGYQIKDTLFRLLSLTLKGETFVNYEEIIKSEEVAVAERKMLEIIYHQFHKVQNLEVDGISKTKILDLYLEEREKNQKMFQLLGRIFVQDKNKKTTSNKNKTPTKVSKTPPKYPNKTIKK